jgi:hypothetical protein
MTANDTDAAVLEGPLGSDVADLDPAAEELEVEDPGLRDLAIRLTENALHQGSAPPDTQAREVDDEQGGRGNTVSAAVKPEPVDAPGVHSGQQPMTNDVDTELQLLQVSNSSCVTFVFYCLKCCALLCLQHCCRYLTSTLTGMVWLDSLMQPAMTYFALKR